MEIIQSPSPNFFSRDGYQPQKIVIHCTDGVYPTDLEWLRNPQSAVSSHYYIEPTGQVHQLVPTGDAAWHSGRVRNPKVDLIKTPSGSYVNPNKYTIGIEVSLRGTEQIRPIQWESLKELVKNLAGFIEVPVDSAHIWRHRDIYDSKTCPGTINIEQLISELSILADKEAIKKEIIALLAKL